jgi:hypothetical protein
VLGVAWPSQDHVPQCSAATAAAIVVSHITFGSITNAGTIESKTGIRLFDATLSLAAIVHSGSNKVTHDRILIDSASRPS